MYVFARSVRIHLQGTGSSATCHPHKQSPRLTCSVSMPPTEQSDWPETGAHPPLEPGFLARKQQGQLPHLRSVSMPPLASPHSPSNWRRKMSAWTCSEAERQGSHEEM